jgi:hypothetical protein
VSNLGSRTLNLSRHPASIGTQHYRGTEVTQTEWPDHTFGSKTEVSELARHVRFTLRCRHRQPAPACPFGANSDMIRSRIPERKHSTINLPLFDEELPSIPNSGEPTAALPPPPTFPSGGWINTSRLRRWGTGSRRHKIRRPDQPATARSRRFPPAGRSGPPAAHR